MSSLTSNSASITSSLAPLFDAPPALFFCPPALFFQRDIVDKWVEASVNPPFVRSANTVLDQSNFQQFNWFDPTKGASAASAQVFANGSDYRPALLQAWNFSVERSMWGTLFSAAYVGNKAQHLSNTYQPNQPRPGPGALQALAGLGHALPG